MAGSGCQRTFFARAQGEQGAGQSFFGQESDWCKSIARPVDEAAEDFLQEKSMKQSGFSGCWRQKAIREKGCPKLVLTRDKLDTY